jgi:2-oxoglutarate dehydrogenase E1 component
VIVNNQLGFTTLNDQGSSSVYVTDVARLLQSPIFHVNGENPEAVAQVVDLALDFRRQFQRDVFIDMYCYRRRGHNEGDEPTFTQPVMYRKIGQIPPVRQSYRDSLLELGEVTMEEAEAIAAWRRNHLESELATARAEEFAHPDLTPGGIWQGYFGGPAGRADRVETGVPVESLSQLLMAQTRFPADFKLHPKLKRAMQRREEMATGAAPLDWATAESLALGSLSLQGYRIRLSGQDVERGTFSQRHAVLHDYDDGHTFVPLQHLGTDQAPIEIVNSPLPEAGVLGFDYGYSLDWPDGLVLWEAQFGDFANAAQVVFDQFIMSAEDKWRRLSGLVMLLPHGFEGQGPEHSSARIERFLTLAAEDNIQIVWPTTPSQYFHCLRQQALRRWRKPLVLLTPKSLLRHKACVSTLGDLATGRFEPVLGDPSIPDPKQVRRILLCSGKLYYDLFERRGSLQRTDVAIIRLEQLYPLPLDALEPALNDYADGTPCFVVQEEPENMGTSRYLRIKLGHDVLDRFPFGTISRPESASPATGSKSTHEAEQEAVLNAAFAE